MTYFNIKKSSTIELFETIQLGETVELIPSCTAVLISQNLMLTVAHNVGYFSHAKFIDLNSQEILMELAEYKTLTPELDEHFDLCIIKLPFNAPLHYRPISILDNNYKIAFGTLLQAAGYGIQEDQEEKSQLRTFDLPFHDLWSNHLRGKNSENLHSIVGDSGGPAFICINKELYLAGVTTGTDEKREYTYFIRPNFFKDWIIATALEMGVEFPKFINPI